MDRIELYSPIQVAVAAFVGGPFAVVYVLWRNFRSLGNGSAAKETMAWGMVFVAAILLVLPFLPDRFPNYAIPAGYTAGAYFFAEKLQVSKEAIEASDIYAFHSGWNVAWLSIGWMIAFLVVAFAWFLVLDYAGVVKL